MGGNKKAQTNSIVVPAQKQAPGADATPSVPDTLTNGAHDYSSTYIGGNAEMHNIDSEDKPCVITIEGRTYDLTKWAKDHPGGPIIHIYHNRDATEVFHAFHGKNSINVLQRFPSTEADPRVVDKDTPKSTKNSELVKGLRSSQIIKDFIELRKAVEREGLLDTNWAWFYLKIASTFAFIPIAYVLNLFGYHFLSALLLGTAWQQFGWISHELLHHSVYKNRDMNRLLGWWGGCVILGFSRIWWNDRHNAHHAATNIDGSDPDIDNLPLLAWSKEDVKRASTTERALIKYQQYYFWFILPLLNVIWCVNSILFTKNVLRNSKYSYYRRYYLSEAIGIALHYVWLSAFLYTSLPTWGAIVKYIIIAKLIAGSFLAFVVFFNHYSCPKLDFDSVAGENFVIMQLVSTRNMTPGVFTDWFWGGLNYQIEHHLFPTMPRSNLYKCSLKIRAFCKKHKIPYLCSDFIEGLGYVKEFLTDIAMYARSYKE